MYNINAYHSKADFVFYDTETTRFSHNRKLRVPCALSVDPLAVVSSGFAGRAQGV